MNTLTVVLVLAGAYLLGNISPSTIIAKSRGIDIKKAGSGNAGTTNALRVLGKKAALITLIVDIGKGTAAVLIAYALIPAEYAMWSALAVFLGHVWPVCLKFKGGKGVATAFGALLAINWVMALLCLGICGVVVLISRMVSLGSIVAALSFLVLSWFMEPQFFIVGIFMAGILIFKHRANIVRIAKGQENKLSFKEK